MIDMKCLVFGMAVLLGSISFGKDSPVATSYTDVLRAVPAAEMPAKAADIVRHAKVRDRATKTADVVRSALVINPAAAPVVVGAVADAVPTMASIAAGAAAAAQPKQAAAIAKAAAAPAPSQARPIVIAVCRAVPNDYREIAIAVSQVVPGASKDILNAVAAAIPGLKPYIDQTLVSYGGNVPSVSTVLDQATKMAQTAAGAPATTSAVRSPATGAALAGTPAQTPTGPATPTLGSSFARGPSVGPPYIPLNTTPTNVTSGNSGQVPPGGRNYAAP